MGKRRALLKAAARPHASDASRKKPRATKLRKKAKLPADRRHSAQAATPTAAAAFLSALQHDVDMFDRALPTVAQLRRRAARPRAPPARPAAFADDSKETMLREVLRAAAAQRPSGRIPSDEHRARMEALKVQAAERRAAKAARWQRTREGPPHRPAALKEVELREDE
ncbi:hypothetical protein AB1Y20_011287 [Prymnesium parvum]|uniref:Ribosome biogenesis protein SLX9 n=1 Tax=Prymnesium parvum TaxID=97485 RepID=A0AB34INV2_PRYPA